MRAMNKPLRMERFDRTTPSREGTANISHLAGLLALPIPDDLPAPCGAVVFYVRNLVPCWNLGTTVAGQLPNFQSRSRGPWSPLHAEALLSLQPLKNSFRLLPVEKARCTGRCRARNSLFILRIGHCRPPEDTRMLWKEQEMLECSIANVLGNGTDQNGKSSFSGADSWPPDTCWG